MVSALGMLLIVIGALGAAGAPRPAPRPEQRPDLGGGPGSDREPGRRRSPLTRRRRWRRRGPPAWSRPPAAASRRHDRAGTAAARAGSSSAARPSSGGPRAPPPPTRVPARCPSGSAGHRAPLGPGRGDVRAGEPGAVPGSWSSTCLPVMSWSGSGTAPFRQVGRQVTVNLGRQRIQAGGTRRFAYQVAGGRFGRRHRASCWTAGPAICRCGPVTGAPTHAAARYRRSHRSPVTAPAPAAGSAGSRGRPGQEGEWHRYGSWWPSPAWTATTAAPRWWRGRCATPAWRSIYTGLHQTPEQIVEAAVQEDADAIGSVRALRRAPHPVRAGAGAAAGPGRRGHRRLRRRDHPRRRHPRAAAAWASAGSSHREPRPTRSSTGCARTSAAVLTARRRCTCRQRSRRIGDGGYGRRWVRCIPPPT